MVLACHFVRLVSKYHALAADGGFGRQRVALSAIFTVHGFLYASWAVRVPAIKAQTGASTGVLGLALLGLSAGAVATMIMVGALCRRLGARQVTVPACGLLSLAVVLPSLAHSAVMLGLALLVFGGTYGCLNVAMNSAAVELVAALRRPVMPGFHAAWSFGGLAGAGLGGLLAPHLSPLRQLALAAACGVIVTAVAGRALLAVPAGPPGPSHLPAEPIPEPAADPAPDPAADPARSGRSRLPSR